MRHLFLINPTAGKNTDPDRISAEIHSLMAERGEPYHIRLTEYPHHAEELPALPPRRAWSPFASIPSAETAPSTRW